MSSKPTDFNYKTPLKKLVQFFHDSRDKWKARSHEKQTKIDFLETKVKDLTNSRDKWKKKAKALEKESKNLQNECSNNNSKKVNGNYSKFKNVEKMGNIQTTTLEKSPVLSEPPSQTLLPVKEIVDKYYGLDDIEILPAINDDKTKIPKKLSAWETATGHQYLLLIQEIGMKMVLEAHTSLRGAMKCFELFSQFFPVQVPSWVTIQNWILRFGLHELHKKRPSRTDWIWLVDSTIQIGTKKAFLIVGVTKAHLLKHGVNLQLKDVELLKLEVVNKLNGNIIYQYLENLSLSIGIPQQIISDHGSDLKKGIELFCNSHRKPTHTYDITHKMALLLKGILEPCHTWQAFLNQCSLTKQKIKQTNQAFLAPPPTQKNKSRYMNLDELIDWAKKLLAYQKRGDFSQIDPTHYIDELVLSQLQIAGYDLMSDDLTPLLGNTYPDKSGLSQALVQILEPNLDKQVQTLILESADLGLRKFSQNFGWINDFESVICD